MARIEFVDLAHAYRPDPGAPADYALQRCGMVWEDGGAYALLGPSGCGKTTLLNIVSGPRGRRRSGTSPRCSSSRWSTTP
jgi:glycerol transport system ATP-binding protein